VTLILITVLLLYLCCFHYSNCRNRTYNTDVLEVETAVVTGNQDHCIKVTTTLKYILNR